MNETLEWQCRDENNVMHALKRASKQPLIIENAKGCFIKDSDGNKYLDGMGGLWCVNVGYGREELAEAAAEQMKNMSYFPMTNSHLPAIELAEKLNTWLNNDYVIFFSNSGSEANEMAFKIARQYHSQNDSSSRHKIISRYRSYHGTTMGALAATGQAERKYKYEPLAAGFLHTVPPDCYHCPLNKQPSTCNLECTDLIDHTITWEGKETVAAIIMEPYISGGGVLIPPRGYMERVKDICEKHGVLLIVDEVINGFGRTGEMFGHFHEDVTPDIITMAKGLTSGYLPLSVTAIHKDCYEAFETSEKYDHFRSVTTFGGNPAACAVALKNIEIIEREKYIENAYNQGEQLYEDMKELLSHPNVGDIRYKGLMMGIELVEDSINKTPIHEDKLNLVLSKCKEKGVIIGKNGDTVAGFNNVLTIAPPLSIDAGTIRFLSGVVKASIYETL
ncbi:aminotransferase [Halobacillus shinanisalinarum]|uniref:Aminotransferase n=1 Tax=Halobacillus shinanisalinarum TaxID=2932258 RepID=A0ABY4GVV3_9BACI|nr:aminotransferase [Halobacillus shinanisalinarum]UOQ92278.1 aminotransferase [Halobacillus shinanisalinarum]